MPARIIAVDVARGLAVLGMFVAHLGVGSSGSREPAWLSIADGRPSASFAILAGVSIALFTGRVRPPQGAAKRWGVLRVLSRAVVIFAFGLLLQALGTPIAVILPSYAAAFMLVVPAISAPPRRAAALAALVAVAVPPLVAWARTATASDGPSAWSKNYVIDLLLTGRYPALAWSAFLLLGLAVGRLSLDQRRIQWALGVAGIGLIGFGYGGGLLAQALLTPVTSPVVAAAISIAPHADSTFELVGNAGVFLVMLSVLLLVLSPSSTAARAARWVATPLTATGQLALSAYCFHIVAIALLGPSVVWDATSNTTLLIFVAVTLTACTIWRATLGQGPLERVLRWLTVGAPPAHISEAPR